MGLKDKLKRTSRIFLSDPKEEAAGNGGAAATPKDEPKVAADANAAAPCPGDTAPAKDEAAGAALGPATENADGALASPAPGDAVACDAPADPEPAAAAAAAAPEPETDAPVKRGLSRRVKSKAEKTAESGEAKRSEFFHKLVKKFKRPVGVPARKPADEPAEKSCNKTAEQPAEQPAETTAAPAVAKADATSGDAVAAARVACAADPEPEVLLDPASEPEACKAAGPTESAK